MVVATSTVRLVETSGQQHLTGVHYRPTRGDKMASQQYLQDQINELKGRLAAIEKAAKPSAGAPSQTVAKPRDEQWSRPVKVGRNRGG